MVQALWGLVSLSLRMLVDLGLFQDVLLGVGQALFAWHQESPSPCV